MVLILLKQVHCSHHSYLWPIYRTENQRNINRPSGYGASCLIYWRQVYIHINKYICIGLCIVGDTINIVWSLLGGRLQFPDLVNRYVTRPLMVVKKGTHNAAMLCVPHGIL